MLSYRILNPSARRKAMLALPKPSEPTYLTRQEILNRHLGKCFFKIGDRATLKKPKKPRLRGTIVAVEEDAEKAQWSGNQPKFITMEIEKVEKSTGRIIDVEKRQVGVKQLLLSYG